MANDDYFKMAQLILSELYDAMKKAGILILGQ